MPKLKKVSGWLSIFTEKDSHKNRFWWRSFFLPTSLINRIIKIGIAITNEGGGTVFKEDSRDNKNGYFLCWTENLSRFAADWRESTLAVDQRLALTDSVVSAISWQETWTVPMISLVSVSKVECISQDPLFMHVSLLGGEQRPKSQEPDGEHSRTIYLQAQSQLFWLLTEDLIKPMALSRYPWWETTFHIADPGSKKRLFKYLRSRDDALPHPIRSFSCEWALHGYDIAWIEDIVLPDGDREEWPFL